MKIYHLSDDIPKINAALALGNFDGVHTAHSALIESARNYGGKCAVFTFENIRTPYLTSAAQRFELFEKLGLDAVYLCDFDSVKAMSYTDFFKKILIEKIGISSAFCGFNFTFGHMAKGKAEDLSKLCSLEGIHCQILSQMECDGITVSSSAIKENLLNGNLNLANRMLGRNFECAGRVIHGKALASKLGFPTINTLVDPFRAPLMYGVYFTLCKIDGIVYPAISNIGIRPTFNDTTPTIETYLLKGDGDFYGKEIKIEFCEFLRSEQKFENTAELSERVEKDIKKALNYFSI